MFPSSCVPLTSLVITCASYFGLKVSLVSLTIILPCYKSVNWVGQYHCHRGQSWTWRRKASLTFLFSASLHGITQPLALLGADSNCFAMIRGQVEPESGPQGDRLAEVTHFPWGQGILQGASFSRHLPQPSSCQSPCAGTGSLGEHSRF
jgi:hypothetical protein